MKLKVLGCSGGIGIGLQTTSFLVNEHTLVDAGTGLANLSLDEMRSIRRIFITHAHLDHIAGLPLMLATIFDTHTHPIELHASTKVVQILKDHIFNWDVWPDFTQLPEERPILSMHPFALGDTQAYEELSITSTPAEHPTPTQGYLVQEDDGQSFLFTGDNGVNPALWPIVNDAKPELLLVDVSFVDELLQLAKDSGHLTPMQLKSELGQLSYQPRVRITHLKPGEETRITEQCKAHLPEWDLEPLQHHETIEL